jgi:cytochrome c oxidase cbb3-type subunit 4
MDPGTINAFGTLVLTIAFVALCCWAYSPSRRDRFERDACLPFLDDDGVAMSRRDASAERSER